MILVAVKQTSKILKPSEQTFDLPSAPIAAELSAILSSCLSSVSAMRSNQLNASFNQKLLVKAIAVISLVTNKTIRGIFSKTSINGCFHQFYLMGRSAFNVCGDRKTSSVCDCHDLGALATLCLADSKTPFFAGTKVPSIKASRISSSPRSYRSCASSWVMRLKRPDFTHCWKRRWHVRYGGYLCGKSFHGAPVRNIHNMPFKTSRGSRGFRPRGSLRRFRDNIIGSIRLHCSFVSSILIILHIQEKSQSFFNYFDRLCKIHISYKFNRL